MLRQRMRDRGSPLRFLGRLLVLLLAATLLWYGAMAVLLAVGVSPSTIDLISGYRTAYDFLAGLTPEDVNDPLTRGIVAGAGLLAFLVFGYLALKELPRPYLTRHDLDLRSDERGDVHVEPRAIEHLAEATASRNAAVTDATGRYDTDELAVNVSVRRAGDADVLGDVQRRVRQALEDHGLPAMPVDVTRWLRPHAAPGAELMAPRAPSHRHEEDHR